MNVEGFKKLPCLTVFEDERTHVNRNLPAGGAEKTLFMYVLYVNIYKHIWDIRPAECEPIEKYNEKPNILTHVTSKHGSWKMFRMLRENTIPGLLLSDSDRYMYLFGYRALSRWWAKTCNTSQHVLQYHLLDSLADTAPNNPANHFHLKHYRCL